MKSNLALLILGLAFILTGCGNQKPAENAAAADEQAAVAAAEPKMMIIAKVYIKPEMADQFIEAAKDIIAKSNEESGCSFYQLYRDPYDNSKFVFVEEYDNQAAVDFHFAADYFNAFGPKIADMVLAPAEIKVITVAKEVIK